jgi:ABC-type sugar transport system substrate-binding protein
MPSPTAAVTTYQYAGYSGDWVVYDRTTCKFVPATQNPATYEAKLRQATSPFKFAFPQPLVTGPFMAKWTPSMNQAAAQAGVTLDLYDTQYPSTTQPLAVADAVVQTKPDVVLEGTEVDAVLPAIQAKYDTACIPVVMADMTPQPNQIFFGSRQADVGDAAATYAVEVAKQRGWTGADMWAVSCMNTEVGTSPDGPYARVAQFQTAVKKAFPDLPAAQTTLLDCKQAQGSLEAQTKMTDWLTAHPNAKYVISNAITDTQALGMYAAFQNAGLKDRAILIGTDVEPAALQIINSGDPTFVGDVNQGPEFRGVYEISLAEDIAEGVPVPTKVYQAPTVVHP